MSATPAAEPKVVHAFTPQLTCHTCALRHFSVAQAAETEEERAKREEDKKKKAAAAKEKRMKEIMQVGGPLARSRISVT